MAQEERLAAQTETVEPFLNLFGQLTLIPHCLAQHSVQISLFGGCVFPRTPPSAIWHNDDKYATRLSYPFVFSKSLAKNLLVRLTPSEIYASAPISLSKSFTYNAHSDSRPQLLLFFRWVYIADLSFAHNAGNSWRSG